METSLKKYWWLILLVAAAGIGGIIYCVQNAGGQ